MIPLLLERLKTDEFSFAVGFHHSTGSVRRKLLNSVDVRRVAAAVRFGAITESMINEFVSSVMLEYRRGHRLPDDLALAALAIVLERRPTDFAEEYLHDLARLKLAEMSTSINVARECLKNRCSVPKHQARSFNFPSDHKPPTAHWVQILLRPRVPVSPRFVSQYPECLGTT
jgi:hypothetical protein